MYRGSIHWGCMLSADKPFSVLILFFFLLSSLVVFFCRYIGFSTCRVDGSDVSGI